jgi:hypothetical protein
LLLASTSLAVFPHAWAGQAPGAAADPDVPVSHQDRVYAAEQFSNTVSVTDPLKRRWVKGVDHGAATWVRNHVAKVPGLGAPQWARRLDH